MDKVRNANQKAEKLIQWLEENAKDEQIKLNAATIIREPRVFIKTHAASLRTCTTLGTAWRAYYMNLHAVKAHYEDELKKKTKTKRPSREHPERQVVQPRKDHICDKCKCKIFKGTEAVLIYQKPKPKSERKLGDPDKWRRFYLHLNCE